MSNKYNLYRVEQREHSALLKSLTDAGFSQVGPKENIQGFELSFFLGKDAPSEPQWVGLYQRFLTDNEELQNQLQSAALVIHNLEHCYVIGLGRAYHAIQQVCDKEFGLNLAERIVDATEIKQKASKFFQSQRSKSIQSFVKNNPFSYDSGESISYLKAKTKDKNLWGERAEFGVSFRFSSDRDPGRLPELIEKIVSLLQQDGGFSFPRTEKVRDNHTLQVLDLLLTQRIIETPEPGELDQMDFEDFQLQGCDFQFRDAEFFSYYLYGFKKDTISPQASLNLDGLRDFILVHELKANQVLSRLRVAAFDANGNSQNLKLKDLLDIVIETEEKSYCLLFGDWFEFSRSYLDFLHEQIDTMEFEEAHEFNFEEMKGESNAKGKKGKAGRDEEWFLNEVAATGGYQVFHQSDFSPQLTKLKHRHKVELMDLMKDKTLYIVKRGSTQKLAYAVDQGTATVNLLKEKKGGFKLDNGKRVRPKTVSIWLVMNLAHPIKQLSEIKSTIFKMKLVEFKRIAQDAGLKPEIRISYEYQKRHQQNFPTP